MVILAIQLAELPAIRRVEKIPVTRPDVPGWRCAGTAAQDQLVGHELAVVFADGPRRGFVAGVGTVGAGRPFPDIPVQLTRSFTHGSLRVGGAWMKSSAVRKIPSHDRRVRRVWKNAPGTLRDR